MDKNIKNRVKKQENTFILILKCAVLSVLLFLIFILIYCYILSHTNISEETMFPVTIIITMISALIGSMICSTKIKKRGLLNGGIVALLFIFSIYYLCCKIYSNFCFNIKSILLIILIIISGMIGGIMGINLEKN